MALEPWVLNHGHHLGPDGQFLFYNNPSPRGVSRVVELQLDEDAWSATQTWEYELGSESLWLGNVQRPPDGNTLISHSSTGQILIVSPGGDVVRSFIARTAELD